MLTRRHHRGGGSGHFSIQVFFMGSILLPTSPACSLLKRVETVEVVRTETQYRDSVAWRDTTVYVPVPLEKDQAIVQVGDTSHRATTVAESWAWVGSDGLLHHLLENRRGAKLPVPVKLPEHFVTTNVQNTREKAEVIVREVKVEKRLNPWQRFRIGAFWWLLGLAAFAWRKPIAALLKKLAGGLW